MSLDGSCFDSLDESVVKKTTVLSNSMKGVTDRESLAAVFTCPVIEKQPYSFIGDSSENMASRNWRTKKVRDDIQELGIFMGQLPNIGSTYIFVESMSGEQGE